MENEPVSFTEAVYQCADAYTSIEWFLSDLSSFNLRLIGPWNMECVQDAIESFGAMEFKGYEPEECVHSFLSTLHLFGCDVRESSE